MRKVSSGFIRCALAAAALGLPAGCDGCDKVHSAEIRFFQGSRQVFATTTIGSATFNASQLDGLPFQPIGGALGENFFADISGDYSLAPVDPQGLPGQQIEAHLFVSDLAATNAKLRSLPTEVVDQWDSATGRIHTGDSGVLPFPPNQAWDTRVRYNTGPLFASAIYLEPSGLSGPAASPPPLGSVKSLRIYKPGLCGREEPFHTPNGRDGIYDRVSDELWNRFVHADHILDPVRRYSRVTTLLDDGIDLLGPMGGFFLYVWFNATIETPPGLPNITDVDFDASYEYQFTLDDGRITVVPTVLPEQGNKGSAPQAFHDALQNDLPSSLHDIAVDRQTLGTNEGLGTACDINLGDPTADNSVEAVTRNARMQPLLEAGIRIGAQKLGLDDAAATRLVAAFRQPSSWLCDAQGLARFILRAKRINVYGDAVELVWFDKADFDDPMYAAYAYAVAGGYGSRLCQRPRSIVAYALGGIPRILSRPISTVKRPDPPEDRGHVFSCGTEPEINGQPLGSQIPLNVCADPATPAVDIAASCVAECKAKLADVVMTPLRLFSAVTGCRVEQPTDTQFSCTNDGSPRYYNGGPAAFRIEGSATAEIAGGDTIHAKLTTADLTILPCAGTACPIFLTKLDMVQEGQATLPGGVLSGLRIQNRNLARGTWLHDGTNNFSLPASALSLGATFDSSGSAMFLEEPNPQPVNGTFTSDGSIFLMGTTIALSGGTAAVTMGGAASGHPPIADFTPKGNVECNGPNAAAVTLSGAPSRDPENDIRLFAWAIDRIVAGSGPSLAALLPLGPHVVALDVFDSRGAANETESPVTVVDTIPPILTAGVDPACLWSPNHKLVLYQIGNGLYAKATDICDPSPRVEIFDATSNQSAIGGGSGNTGTDVLFGKHAFCVRAERAGTVTTPRSYTIAVRATDASGNSTTKTVVVDVPHDQGTSACPVVDSSRVVADDDPRCTE